MSTWTYPTRKQYRKDNNIPDWVPIGDDDPDFKRLWVEDDSKPPDGEGGHQAWQRIFGEPIDRNNAAKCWDGGDSYAELYSHNRVFEHSYEGSTIWQYMPPRKF